MEDSPKDGCLRYPSGESLESLKSPSSNTSSKIKQQRSHSLYANKLASDFDQVKRNLTHNNYDEPFFKIYDDPSVLRSYSNVPILEIQQLPRGGLSFETKAVGRIQFGIPPETIKDSMQLGLVVPSIYIVPVERFCLEMGPALGINLAEFEFPAYFNYFNNKKRCTLVVDSQDVETNIRRVFGETLLGPAQFRSHENPTFNEDEDFSQRYPVDARPNFYKEFKWFREQESTDSFDELCIDMLLDFAHSRKPARGLSYCNLGVPRPIDDMNDASLKIPARRPHRRHTSTTHAIFDGIEADNNSSSNGSTVRNDGSGSGSVIRRSISQPDLSTQSSVSNCASSRQDLSWNDTPSFFLDDEDGDKQNHWRFSQVVWLGEITTVYPDDTTTEERMTSNCPRVEIFKMVGGTEYVVHDIDKQNYIIGKVTFNGSVRVPDEISVEGFLTSDIGDSMINETIKEENKKKPTHKSNNIGKASSISTTSISQISILRRIIPPTFYPPSFGVTVLGNSHGFDKNGSVSGYVLWINGRGVMIDPPPYSSGTLEREGIRPRMIMAIIITHCHADHDAGTFQKVMTGSRVSLITTPTIYKSFIRKYSALSGLSPAFLRHSHHYRPAIIGEPLIFQGATFHFSYTLHTIPCITFKVEWRRRSMVFTGDHMNNPAQIESLVKQGVLTKERSDELNNLALQPCDLLLHESGLPPIHTPLDVLLKLPETVKKRLFVVHTSSLPENCALRVAPSGTAGTIRLDEPISFEHISTLVDSNAPNELDPRIRDQSENILEAKDYTGDTSPRHIINDSFSPPLIDNKDDKSVVTKKEPPLVLSRLTSVSDAWFILNLLSSVPFLSSLSFANTMDVLEEVEIEVYCKNDIVLSADRRVNTFFVIWEGSCMEYLHDSNYNPSIWHAGDWTGPRSLQPDCCLSCECIHHKSLKDIIAISAQGVKIISMSLQNLLTILKSGSPLYRKYMAVQEIEIRRKLSLESNMITLNKNPRDQNMISPSNFVDTISNNSVLSKLTPLQKRHLETIVDGPEHFNPGQYFWKVGGPLKFSFIIVQGTAKFAINPKLHNKARRNSTGGISLPKSVKSDYLLHRIQSSQIVNPPVSDKLMLASPGTEYFKLEIGLQLRMEEVETWNFDQSDDHLTSTHEDYARNARDRYANKILSQLYSRQVFIPDLVFSRGNFLSDTTRMIRGSLTDINSTSYTSHETESPPFHMEYHSSTIAAGSEGCIALIIPKDSLINFFDTHPGVLLSLLGTQVVI